MMGAVLTRYKWHKFRERFNKLRLCPVLNYGLYQELGKDMSSKNEKKMFRLFGYFESVTDGETLWIRSDDLTIPVLLKNTETYLIQMKEWKKTSSFIEPSGRVPEKIRWEKVSTLTENAKVYVGGDLLYKDGQWVFASTKENPLVILFYDGSDQALASYAMYVCRPRNEYWNALTPYSLVIGALGQLLIAVLFLSSPNPDNKFNLTRIVSIIALFIPLYPILPPGLLFSVVYRRFAWQARKLRAYCDLVRQPLCYLAQAAASSKDKAPLKQSVFLANGEEYGFVCKNDLPVHEKEDNYSLLLPINKKNKKGIQWHIFGSLIPGKEHPVQPKDAFAVYGILPGRPDLLSKRFIKKAYSLEFIAWLLLLAGIGLNIFFFYRVMLILF